MDVRLDSRILFSPTSSGQNLQKPSHLILDLRGYKFNFYEDEFTDFITDSSGLSVRYLGFNLGTLSSYEYSINPPRTDEEEATLTRDSYLGDPDYSPVYSVSVIMDMIEKEHELFRNSEVLICIVMLKTHSNLKICALQKLS